MAYDVVWGKNTSLFNFHDGIDIHQINEAHGVMNGSINFQNYHSTIWNFLDVDYSLMKQKDVKEPVYVGKAAAFSVHNVKVAIVAKEKRPVDLGNELIRLYKKIGISWEVHIFDSMDAAVQWCHPEEK